MKNGTIKFYNSDKGYGFLKIDGDAGDLFFHVSALSDADWEPMKGDRCTFVEGVNPKDNRARAEQVARL